MRGACALVAVAVCTLVGSRPGAAQTVLSVRTAGLYATYADSLSGSAVSVAPRLELARGASRAALETGVARFDSGEWVVQAGAEGVTARALGRHATLAVVAGASGAWVDGASPTGSGQFTLLLGRRAGAVTLHGGLTGGAVRRIGGSTDPQWGGLLAGALQRAGVDLSARAQRLHVGDDRFTDLMAGALTRRGRLALDLTGGLRHFDGGATDPQWQLQVTSQVRPVLALELAAGANPRSPEGFTRGFYLTAGVRVARPLAAPRVAIERVAAGRVRVRFALRGAAAVGIAGEWNAWTPAAMERSSDGHWSAELPLGPGAHRFAIVIDGERWTVPDGVPRLPDGFGGEVGILVIG